jgi:hypothetical protein
MHGDVEDPVRHQGRLTVMARGAEGSKVASGVVRI